MLHDNQNLEKPDWVIVSTTVFLLVVGAAAVFSATHSANPSSGAVFTKHIIRIGLGLILLGGTVLIPMRLIYNASYPLYIFTVILLIAVLFLGSGTGVKRWFVLGPFRFQPSEIAKIATLLALAKYISTGERRLTEIRSIATVFLIVFIPMLLIVRQPDLGTALVFPAILLPALYWGGMSGFTIFLFVAPLITLVAAFNLTAFFIVMAILVGAMAFSGRSIKVIIPNFLLNIAVGVITPLLWSQLHNYQKNRVLTFLGLIQDPQGAGYQVLQSKVAIGSGHFWGKGFLEGTQTHLRFLPEQHTDFIFSVIGEEFGFLGAMLVLAAFFLLFSRSLKVAKEQKSEYASLICIGAVVILAFHVLINVGMTVGIMPVTGLPLPFLSYGGSSLLISMILVGLVVNGARRRFLYL